jgi:hypothetical protein
MFTTMNPDDETQTWHLLSSKCLNTMKDDSKATFDKKLNYIEYNNDGTKLAIYYNDKVLRLHF